MRVFTTSINYILKSGKIHVTVHVPKNLPVILTAYPSGRLEHEWLGHDVFKPATPHIQFQIAKAGGEAEAMTGDSTGVPVRDATCITVDAAGIGSILARVGRGMSSTDTPSVASRPQHSDRKR